VDADLVVVGSGAAGLTAAVAAAVDGASVIVLEKAEVVGGTSAVSGGSLWIPANRHMADEGVSDSREEALAYMRACAGDQGDDEHLVTLADRGPELVEFLEDRVGIRFWAWPGVGGALDYRPWLPGAKPGARTLDAERFDVSELAEWAPRLRRGQQAARWFVKYDYYAQRRHVHRPPPGEDGADPNVFQSGLALVGRLLRACLDHGVAVWTSTRARELVLDDGRVAGVVADGAAEEIAVAARHGVLLATGGYAGSEELRRLWLTRPLDATCEVESNTGDGHLMGLAAGAGVAGLGDAWWMPQILGGRDPAGGGSYGGSREDRTIPHTLIVNRLGRRFLNESMNYYDACEAFGAKEGGSFRNYPAWWICDDQARRKYPIVAAKFPGGEVPEWMAVAQSVAELASKLGLDEAALAATVDRFNAFARAGVDEDFGRGESAWDREWGDPDHRPNPALGTVEQPPFYALELRSGALATRGGLRVNGRAEVLGALPPFDPIPGLYAAGNCSSGGVAGAYVGAGATIGAAMTFGYVAGRRAAELRRSRARVVDLPTRG
jgi:3-oxosteroid 1-dehydrogenase